MQFGIIGSGSWATALAKILTDNGQAIYWLVRNEAALQHLQKRRNNPHYLRSVFFNPEFIRVFTDIHQVISHSDCLIVAVPSAYVLQTFQPVSPEALSGKRIVSAVKGILPDRNILLSEYFLEMGVGPENFFTIMGPCHAEEVAAEKLSYLTFSGKDETITQGLASYFKTDYLNTVINEDVTGVQFAAVLKNIYALGAGMAHGLEYGDNFLSVLIANCADEMAGFLKKSGIRHIEVGFHEEKDNISHQKIANYAASVYLGDLLVTCYSPFSRNRTFGNMIGKGYSVTAAQLELGMVAEGFNASKCIFGINQEIKAEMPIAEMIYRILWENVKVDEGFNQIEAFLI